MEMIDGWMCVALPLVRQANCGPVIARAHINGTLEVSHSCTLPADVVTWLAEKSLLKVFLRKLDAL